MIYYGCGTDAGHYVWRPGMQRVREAAPTPFDMHIPGAAQKLDGGYTPPMGYVEGAARLTHALGWTVLSYWDNTVDNRPGSHSTFAVEGTHGFDAMLAAAREHFPTVFARQKFEVTLALATAGVPERSPGGWAQ